MFRPAFGFWLLLAACGGGASGDASDTSAPGAPRDGVVTPVTPVNPVTPPATEPTWTPPIATTAPPAPKAPPLPLGTPIVAAADTWTWIDFPDSSCDDGSPTGIGVYLSSKSPKLTVYLEGGGACWDYNTCTVGTSTHGPYGKAQFAANHPPDWGTVLGHTNPISPFNDWSKIYIPYCTGDVHAGDAVQTYQGLFGLSRTVHHEGHANVLAFLKRIAATFPHAPQVAITGSSAGGGGAVFNYPNFRAYWPDASMMLIDDSLPLFEKNGISASERASWFSSWNLGPLSEPFCGKGCETDLSLWMAKLASTYPFDRMALLSSLQDATIRTFLYTLPAQYQTNLMSLVANVLEPTGHFKHFFVAGDTHTMLNDAIDFKTANVPLWTWLTQMANDDPNWVSLSP